MRDLRLAGDPRVPDLPDLRDAYPAEPDWAAVLAFSGLETMARAMTDPALRRRLVAATSA